MTRESETKNKLELWMTEIAERSSKKCSFEDDQIDLYMIKRMYILNPSVFEISTY